MSDGESKLLEAYRRLPPAEQESLLAFAEFLVSRSGAAAAPAVIPEPEPIPRPDNESVIAAIKRLSASYHMLDRSRMLHETSGLVAEHLMQGRAAVEVIDELEVVFRRHYELQFGDHT